MLLVDGAVPQTALILVMTRRYSSELLNFAVQAPEDSQRDRKMPFCAQPADRTGGFIPVQAATCAGQEVFASSQ
jgi:hypothetical protein